MHLYNLHICLASLISHLHKCKGIWLFAKVTKPEAKHPDVLIKIKNMCSSCSCKERRRVKSISRFCFRRRKTLFKVTFTLIIKQTNKNQVLCCAVACFHPSVHERDLSFVHYATVASCDVVLWSALKFEFL